MKKEYGIGEEIKLGLEKLKCVAAVSSGHNRCNGCYMLENLFDCCDTSNLVGQCSRDFRSDHKDVIFVKILENQALSIDQMVHLNELGLDTSNSSLIYIEADNELLCTNRETTLHLKNCRQGHIYCNAFSLQDVIECLPKEIIGADLYNHYLYFDFEDNRVVYGNTGREGFEIYYEVPIQSSVLQSAYEMLCWCLENGHIK